MPTHRLQKLIAASGMCSRRHAEKLLVDSRVKVNGKVANLGDKADPIMDEVLVDNSPIPQANECKVILLNKPLGVICSCHDPHNRKTVLDLIPNRLRKGLYPVGRLDRDSRGAILLTNIGDLTLRLTHPRYLHLKTYNVWLEGIPSDESLDKWRKGLILDGRPTMPAKIEVLRFKKAQSLIKVVLGEGRNRQIRRIASQLGHPVIDLKRTGIASFNLNDLKEGEWRDVEPNEWHPIISPIKTKMSD